MPQTTELIFHKPDLATKIEILVHRTMLNAPYIHLSHDSILELWRTFLNDQSVLSINTVSHFSYAPPFHGPHFLTKMLESKILYDHLRINILSV